MAVLSANGASRISLARSTEKFLMNEWLSLLVSWSPFVVLIGAWVLLARGIGARARGPSGATMIELYEQQLAETRRMSAALERIAAVMEKRPQQ
jgi:hypothetical protein